MLPDLRIVIAAVVSTFILTVGVGFFASSRLIQEQMTARIDTKGFDDTPINRIALNWPEPVRTDRHLDLDFAVTARGSGNPVRDLASEPAQMAPSPRVESTPPMVVATSATTDAPASVSAKEVAPDPKPVISVEKASDSIEEKAIAPVPLSEPAAVAPASDSTADRHVVVRLDDAYPNGANAAEPTGSIAAPAETEPADAPAVPVEPDMADAEADAATADAGTAAASGAGSGGAAAADGAGAPTAPDVDVPTPETHARHAALPEHDDEVDAIAKSSLAEPAKPRLVTRKPRKAAARPRPAARVQPVQAQIQQPPPFDLFGLFRTSPNFQVPPQVVRPTTPVP